MYIRLFIANDVFVVISLPKSFIYCLPIILFYPTYIFYGGYGFSVGAIPCGCPSSILFWSTVWGIVFILGRPRGSPLRESFQPLGLFVQFLKWRGNDLALRYMRAIGCFGNVVVMLTICFQPFSRHRSLSLSHFQYAQIRMPCYGNKWL